MIADDHKGPRAAARRVFNAIHQRCRVYWTRNALAHAPSKQRTAVAAPRALGPKRQHKPLERVNRQIKRRSDVSGILPNDEAIVRLVGALMIETNDEWTVARRCMNLETLARVTDKSNLRLPAVAT